MAECQAPGMLAVAASSRASSLPQVFSAPKGSAFGGDQKMWERACSRWRWVRRQGCWLWRPHREQARTQVFSAPTGSAFGGDQKMWERACSRWRSVRRQGCWLWRPHREQARSHKYFQRPKDLRSAEIKKCVSEPARDGGGSGARDVGCSGLIASKLAPTSISAPTGSAFGGDQKMWERACSRWRSVRRQGCWL
ncbi:hypothetical protein PS938_05650 [Pseudomonas fluorescens]|nr:hypothetical protein PS938_05650 [Pseudomonas fluorescens]